MENQFDDIRPFRDHEVNEKLAELLAEPAFAEVLAQIYPEVPFEALKAKMLQMQSVASFQEQVILPVVERLVASTTKGLSAEGLENLKQNQAYLIISNHRDIVLDSAFINYLLKRDGNSTAEIAIGDNLLTIPWVVNLVKLNKSFMVKRNLPRDQMLRASIQLSNYIQHSLVERKSSIWIAQREGRSKDGNDRTNPGILKMFYLSANGKSAMDFIRELNILPVAISYEFNPCDALMLPELLARSEGETYLKAEGEDVLHMATGIQGPKGKVKIVFGKPLNESLDQFAAISNRNDLFTAIAAHIDQEIHRNYELFPSNYMAYDLLEGGRQYAEQYDEQALAAFEGYVADRMAKVAGDTTTIRRLLLEMYANPVYNKQEAEA